MNDHRAKDACVHIKHHRRHRSESGVVGLQAVGQTTLDFGGGYLDYTPELCRVMWLGKFRPNVPVKYDRASNP
jgi:Xaa-Pro aminopeptidase